MKIKIYHHYNDLNNDEEKNKNLNDLLFSRISKILLKSNFFT